MNSVFEGILMAMGLGGNDHEPRGLEVLRGLVEATSPSTGQAFFDALTENLPLALGVKYAFIGELTGPQQQQTTTLSAWWNGARCANFSYALEGTPCASVLAKGELAYYPTDVAAMFPLDTALARLGIQSYMGTPLRAADDSYVGMLVVMHDRPLDETAEPSSILRIFADRAAAELQRLRDEQRWREARERLLRGQKMEALGRLASGIAHDFNNLLTAVDGYVSLAEVEEDEREAALALQGAHDAVARAAALVKRLLAFAREQPTSPQRFAPSSRIADTGELIARLLGKSIGLERDLCHPCWSICMDPVQFEQVLINLVVNARDAMNGQGELRITTRCRVLGEAEALTRGLRSAGDYVLTEVRDNGAGMDEATLRRACEPFFTTRLDKGGSGMGLATCDGIVSQAGGALWIDSAPGQGTTVFVALRRCDDTASCAATARG